MVTPISPASLLPGVAVQPPVPPPPNAVPQSALPDAIRSEPLEGQVPGSSPPPPGERIAENLRGVVVDTVV